MMSIALPQLVECIPNFSEGRDPEKIQAIAESIQSVEGVHLLHVDSSPAANRTVMTFAGAPGPVSEAAFQAIKTASRLIDMRIQDGVHPRVGATDVCPIVPLQHCNIADADIFAKKLGARIGADLEIPVYLYEASAKHNHRRALPDIRKGQYEGFAEKIKLPDWKPDYGPATFNAATGSTVIGARKILVAFNISLNTPDVQLAERIAARLRSRGYRNTAGEKIAGALPMLRSIGWYMADYEQAQVSFNLLDYTITSPLQVFAACKVLAEESGVEIVGSEVIGLLPESCLLEAGTLELGIEKLKLSALKTFDPDEKILEYALRRQGIVLDLNSR